MRKEKNETIVHCCRYCPSFHMTDEGNYTLFECYSLPIKTNDPYGQVLQDIGWSNFDRIVSKFCPHNIRKGKPT